MNSRSYAARPPRGATRSSTALRIENHGSCTSSVLIIAGSRPRSCGHQVVAISPPPASAVDSFEADCHLQSKDRGHRGVMKAGKHSVIAGLVLPIATHCEYHFSAIRRGAPHAAWGPRPTGVDPRRPAQIANNRRPLSGRSRVGRPGDEASVLIVRPEDRPRWRARKYLRTCPRWGVNRTFRAGIPEAREALVGIVSQRRQLAASEGAADVAGLAF